MALNRFSFIFFSLFLFVMISFQNCSPPMNYNSNLEESPSSGSPSPSHPGQNGGLIEVSDEVLYPGKRFRSFNGAKTKTKLGEVVSPSVRGSGLPQNKETNGVLYQMSQNGSSHKLLVVSGNFYEMGYAHGSLLAEDIKKYVEYYKQFFLPNNRRNNQDIIPFYESSFQTKFPQRYQDEIQGIVDGVNSKLSPIAAINFGDILALQFELELAGIGCTAFGFKNEKTKNGHTMVSRSLDWGDQSAEKTFVETQLVISSKPTDRSTPNLVSFSRVGLIGVATAFTDKGVYSEMNYSGVEKMPVTKVNGQVYPHLLYMRDLLESFDRNPIANHQDIRRILKSFVVNSHRQDLKPVHAAQYLFAYDNGFVDPYMAVIEGIGVYERDPVLRESDDFASKAYQYENKSYQKSNIIFSETESGLMMIDEEGLYEVEDRTSDILLKNVFTQSEFLAPMHILRNSKAREIGIRSDSSLGPEVDRIIGAFFNHPQKQKLFQVTQHGKWGVGSVQRAPASFTGSHYSVEAEGFVSFFKNPEGKLKKEGVWVSKKGSVNPAFGRIYLEPKKTQVLQGIEIVKGDAYISILNQTEKIFFGSYHQIGELLIQGEYTPGGSSEKGIWVFYNPSYVDQNFLVNVNNWFNLDTVLYTTQDGLFGTPSSGLDRYFRGALYMLFLKQASLESVYERLIHLYQDTDTFFEADSLLQNRDQIAQDGAMQMSSVNVRTGDAVLSFARIKRDVQGAPLRNRVGSFLFENAYSSSVMPIVYSKKDFFE
jgi:hypothetical protein